MKLAKAGGVRPVATPARAPSPEVSAGPDDDTIPAQLYGGCHVSCQAVFEWKQIYDIVIRTLGLFDFPKFIGPKIDLLAEDSPEPQCSSIDGETWLL